MCLPFKFIVWNASRSYPNPGSLTPATSSFRIATSAQPFNSTIVMRSFDELANIITLHTSSQKSPRASSTSQAESAARTSRSKQHLSIRSPACSDHVIRPAQLPSPRSKRPGPTCSHQRAHWSVCLSTALVHAFERIESIRCTVPVVSATFTPTMIEPTTGMAPPCLRWDVTTAAHGALPGV